jgi:DNA-binding NtrC family response regulator
VILTKEEIMKKDVFKKKGVFLIVDDDKNVRDFLKLFLKKKGFQNVETVQNGQEALAIVEKEDINLVLLDVRMPGLDGIEVLRAIKKIRKDIPVVMITAYPDEEKVKEAMKEGAYDYIIKPFDLFYLEVTLLTKIIQLSSGKKNK